MEARDKKRKGDALEHDQPKKQKTNNEINYLELLPFEIVCALAKSAGSYPTVLLSLTSKHFYSSLSNDNKFWFGLYRHERLVNLSAVDLDDSSLKEELAVLEEDDYCFDRYDDELTANTADIQNELIADDYTKKYIRSVVSADIVYTDETDFKELAVDEWLKRQHFELWNDTTCASLYKSNCICRAEHTILALYDGDGNELSVNDDLSDDDQVEWPADSTIESESVSGEEDKSDADMMISAQSNSNESDASESDSDEIEPVMLNAELRDKIIKSVENSAQFNMFVQVLDAAVLGHIPSSTCHDTQRLAIAKLNHPIVCLGNVTDSVINQISLAVNDTDMRQCLSMLFCAFQKLCIADLLYLNQGVKSCFPYLANVFSVYNIERSVPMSWHDMIGYNEPHWAFNLHSVMASNDELDSLPAWLSLRHSIHRLMRLFVANATPFVTERAVEELAEFIRSTLQSVIDTKGASSPAIDVTEQDIFKAVCKNPHNLDFITPHTMYRNSELMCENMVQMYSESECSYESSYSDASEEEEDLAQFVEENKKNILGNEQPVHSVTSEQKPQEEESSEEELNDYQGLTALIKSSVQGVDDDTSPLLMRTALVYGQSDLSAQQLDDLGDEVLSDSEEHVEEDLMQWLQVDDDTYNSDYVDKMIHVVKQDAAYYAGSGEIGDQAEEKLNAIDSQVPSDLPELRQDLTDEQRAKILEVRRETNRVLKEEIMREHNEFLTKKFARLHDNFTMYYGTKHPLQCKAIKITFFSDNKENIKRAVDEAIELIRKSEVLKTVHIYDHHDEGNNRNASDSQTPIQSLFNAIQNSTSIDSLKLYGCYFGNVRPLIQLLQSKQFTRLSIVLSNILYLISPPVEQLLQELSKHKSLKELTIDYPLPHFATIHIHQAVLALVPTLEVLRLKLPAGIDQSLLKQLKRHILQYNSVQKVIVCFPRYNYERYEHQEYFKRKTNKIIEAAKPAQVIFAPLL